METHRILWTDGWRFALTEDERAVQPDYDDGAWRAVDLPHDWQIEQTPREDAPGGGRQGYFPRASVGVYRLRFRAKEAWRGKCVRVLFDGVQRFATVYLNGRKAGGRPYGYLPILCDLTDALRYGEDNVLAVWVDNRDPSHGEWPSAGGDRWYSGAGIYRNVWLLVQEASRIVHDGIRIVARPLHSGPGGDVPDVAGIRCDRARVSIRVELEGDLTGATLRTTIVDGSGRTVYRADEEARPVLQSELTLEHPLLWTLESPALYRASFVLLRGESALDEHAARFGVREAVFDGEDGFVLNGVKTKLWGVNLHHDGGCVGAAVPPELWRRRLQTLKGLGVNAIRASHNPMAEEVYDLCDEMGLLVVDELYDKWSDSPMYYHLLYDEWHERDLRDMIRRDANHPCVILWSVGNEVHGQYSELFFRSLRELCDQTRREDPTRAVTAALISFVLPEYNDTLPLGQRLGLLRRYAEVVDVLSLNYMENYYERLRESGVRKPILGSEVRAYYCSDTRRPDASSVSLESPYAVVDKHDWVCGSFVWAGIDYLGESPFWPLRGWTGSLLDSTADVKLRAWYCASHWMRQPVLKLAVYDESEPWDGARGMWGFPQMRAHWKYPEFEKIRHVAVMTNCDTVKLYQNSQTARVARPADFPDGMAHFYLPYLPGVLRAEGYRGGLLAAEDALYSDHEAHTLRVEADRDELPADGRSVALIDAALEDRHGARYMLEDRPVRWRLEGCEARVLIDNGDAYARLPFDAPAVPMHNGHVLLLLRAGHQPGVVTLSLRTEGFEERTLRFTLRPPQAEDAQSIQNRS